MSSSVRQTLRQKISRFLLLFLSAIIICYVVLRGIAFFQYQEPNFEGQYFSYKGKSVRYKCQGEGSPLVFFETGFGSDSQQSWSPIIAGLPKNFTACYYDRLGHGGSDDVPTTFTTDDKSQLQESLIKHIAGDNSVVLVAKSYGGIIARRTLARDNIDVAAVIFLDSAHENQHNIMRGKFDPIAESVKTFQYVNAALGLSAIRGVFREYDSPESRRLDQYFGSFRWAHVLSTYRNEKGNFTPLEDFNYNFGDLKMLVVSHDSEVYEASPRFSVLKDYWPQMQQSIAALSNNSEIVIAKGATHNIPADAPDFVIQKITEIVEGVTK